jgi:hypothetical protein
MKGFRSPRETLLSSHRAAERKLDRIRAEVLGECLQPESTRQTNSWFSQAYHSLYLEIFAPAKTTWALIGATWLLIIAFNLADRLPSQPAASGMARVKQPSGDTLMAFREQEQLLRELIGPNETSKDVDRPRRKGIAQPRSEGILNWRSA